MSSQSPVSRRPLPLVIADVVAAVALLLFGAVFALAVITTAIAFGSLNAECGAGPYDGIQCNSTVLGIVVYSMIGVAVLAFLLGFGMVLVNLIRRRYTFFWPLGALILTVIAFYVGTWIAGMTVPA